MVREKRGDGTWVDIGEGSALTGYRLSAGGLALILSSAPLAMTIERIVEYLDPAACSRGHVGMWTTDTRGWRICAECHREQARRHKASRARTAAG